jgi:hypothetical protein
MKDRKFLIIEDQAHFKECYDLAKKLRLKSSLNGCMKSLTNIAKNGKGKIHLYKDFAPFSFYWTAIRDEDGHCFFNGGVIYHGSHDNGGDGSYPTLSVSVSPSQGWQVHT